MARYRGFQHTVIEYARDVLGAPDAELFITPLACSLFGRSMELRLVAGSQVAACYGEAAVTEQYYCSMGVEPARLEQLQRGPLSFRSGQEAVMLT